MFKHILAAIDFSPAWPQLEAQLTRLPDLGCQRVTLAYVIVGGYTQAPEVSHREYYEEKLAGVAARLKQDAGLEVDWTLRVGSVARELIAAAQEHGAATLLVGSQGHGVVEKLLLGSTALDLARLADRPLLLAPINGDDAIPLERIYRPLLATDGSRAASGAEAAFLKLLPDCGKGIVVSVGRWDQGEDDAGERETIDQHVKALSERAGTDAFDTLLIGRGKPSQVIIETAKEKDADLIIIGRRGQNRVVELLLGSTAEAVCRGSHRLVLLMPAEVA